jgi:hypothetical protein
MIPAVWMLASQGAPRRRERPLVEAAVIEGQERWPRRIGGLANELRLQIAELSKDDVARAPTTRRTLKDLVAFAGYALALIGELAQFPNAATWGEWLKRPREPAWLRKAWQTRPRLLAIDPAPYWQHGLGGLIKLSLNGGQHVPGSGR